MKQSKEGLATRKSVDRELAETRRILASIVEASDDAIISTTLDGTITSWNRGAQRIFGYMAEEMIGQPVSLLYLPDSQNETEILKRIRTGGHVDHYETVRRHKNGQIVSVSLTVSPIRDASGQVAGSSKIARDITETKQLREQEQRTRATGELAAKNEQLEARNREVEKANRLKNEFLASMSHELRTPLYTILGFTELLVEEAEGPLNPKQKRFLGHILQDSQHLLQMINEVLDLSKIESGRLDLQLEPLDFNSCVEEVMTAIRPQSEVKNIRLDNRNTFRGPLQADRLRLKEILNNLLSNAMKFTPDGGSVWLESLALDGFLQVAVCDTGIGIPAEEHEAIFEKFYQVGDTARGVREGTGLGLSIIQKLVELHGGKIWLESQRGQGSRFIFTLALNKVGHQLS